MLLEVDAEGLTLTALDSHTHQLRLRVAEASPGDTGMCLVHGDGFKGIVSKCESGAMSLDYDEANNLLRVQAETDLKLTVSQTRPEEFPVIRELPPVVGVVDGHHFQVAVNKALEVLVDGEFVTFVARGDQLMVYTRSKGSMYSRAVVDFKESTQDFEVAIPRSLFVHLPPKMSGLAEIRLHPEMESFAVSQGSEHLLVKSVANDTTSTEVEHWLAKPSNDFFIIKADALLRDLGRANYFKDNNGLHLELDKGAILASCKSQIGSMNTRHEAFDLGGEITAVDVDPVWLEQAVSVLGAVDLVVEQLREVQAGFGEGAEDSENIWLRLRDREHPDARVLVVPSMM